MIDNAETYIILVIGKEKYSRHPLGFRAFIAKMNPPAIR